MAPTSSPTIRTERPRSTERPVEIGMVVEDAQTGYVGAVVRIEYGRMELEDRHGRSKPFPIGPGYLIDGKPGDPDRAAAVGARTPRHVPRPGRSPCRARRRRWRWPVASTSRAATTPNSSSRCGETICGSRAWSSNTSAASTIWSAIVEEFRPGPSRRLGVLVDHLVAGSKEARIADAVRRGPGGAHTLVVGHPFIDIWQAVKPERLGIVGVAGRAARRGLEARRVPGARMAARAAGRHRQGMAADPRPGAGLERPGARTHRPRRGADRLRDRRIDGSP